MSLREALQTATKDAMRARAADRLSTLRLMSSAIKDREIAGRSEAGVVEVSEADILAVFARMVKQRHDSAKAYAAGGRADLEAKELAEIVVIEAFMPRQLTGAELEDVIAAAIAEVGAVSIKDMGRVMALLKARFAGQMDFGAVGGLIKARFG